MAVTTQIEAPGGKGKGGDGGGDDPAMEKGHDGAWNGPVLQVRNEDPSKVQP